MLLAGQHLGSSRRAGAGSRAWRLVTNMEVFQEINLCLCDVSATDPDTHRMPGPQLTSIMRSSLLGTSTNLICLTATASPVPQLKAL